MDPAEAMSDFNAMVKSSMMSGREGDGGGAAGMMASLGLPDIKGDLAELLYGANDPPPGKHPPSLPPSLYLRGLYLSNGGMSRHR